MILWNKNIVSDTTIHKFNIIFFVVFIPQEKLQETIFWPETTGLVIKNWELN